jgi:hypothetical protein
MTELAKAKLIELDDKLEQPKPKPDGKTVDVQFNPESLKVSYANQIANRAQGGSGDQSTGPAGRQFVGTGTTKMSLQLWFDASTPGKDGSHVDDVRRLTGEVTYFMTPQPYQGNDSTKLPPGVRFEWGSFKFDGIVDSLEETLEYFSRDGHPLRASISLNLSQEKILVSKFDGSGRIAGAGKPAGSQPLASIKAGDNLQSIAAASGKGGDWQRIAAANGIENPRQMQLGQLLDLNPLRKR